MTDDHDHAPLFIRIELDDFIKAGKSPDEGRARAVERVAMVRVQGHSNERLNKNNKIETNNKIIEK